MKTLKILLLLMLFSIAGKGQIDPKNYQGDLIGYLTEVNLYTEAYMRINYCQCKKDKAIINSYRDVQLACNRFLNSYITELTLEKSKKAMQNFKERNNSNWVNTSQDMQEISSALTKLSGTSCVGAVPKFLPEAITVAEFTGLINSLLGLIKDSKARKDAQKASMIKILGELKIPSVSNYKCVESK